LLVANFVYNSYERGKDIVKKKRKFFIVVDFIGERGEKRELWRPDSGPN